MDTEKLFDDPRLTAVGLLYEAHDGLVARLEATWKSNGLSGLDLNALMRLSRSPGRKLRMTDLATQTNLSTSGVTRLVDRLERNKFVRREPDPHDRRSSYAVLTAAGAARVAQVLPAYLEGVDRWFTKLLTPKQLADLTASLRIIRDATAPGAAQVSE
ncbi:MarR family winged helix-turn-helix transcriptional regulator [Nocardia cyriacigeorgica]|uniref:MarR family winged helix-turn-helix transcriptional regulator n=1 Tax=Nocardia cyriacigeorgica TaxID=135487 RepID=UPI001895BAD2|nr:MarR family transcriptional regulator [Nocardia cyriacigeorgica]MBF6435199.1 MarR family transcriptional regulator [Nocardia cyriacigeorgica]MBF6454735.1 MarR family transcriptional regulator [Nocardia cyriacigeorgica]MBF6477159.1 MarR family transcriptional regulator [Nocardia cyriacigeorgica]MBF6552629.1 MarR family transcriptional regulator [Nocardia cyriacigeorgica]